MSWASATEKGGGKLELPYGVSLRTIASYIVDMWGLDASGTITIPETHGGLTEDVVRNYRTYRIGVETIVDVYTLSSWQLFRFAI